MTGQRLLLVRGDDRTLTATVTASDLTTATALRFTAKRAVTDTDANAVFAKTLADGITVNSATQAVIRIEDTDWEDKHYPVLVWDLEVIDAAGDITTLAYGDIMVTDDVTRDAP